MAEEPFTVLGDAFNVFVGKDGDGSLVVTVRYTDSDTAVILCGDEIVQLQKVLTDVLEGRVEWEGDAALEEG